MFVSGPSRLINFRFIPTILVPIGTYLVKRFLRYSYGVAKSEPELIGADLVRLLRDKRLALGLSMNAVAKRAGLSHTMVSRVERELRKPTLDTLLRITGAMGVELWPLIKRAEVMGRGAKMDDGPPAPSPSIPPPV